MNHAADRISALPSTLRDLPQTIILRLPESPLRWAYGPTFFSLCVLCGLHRSFALVKPRCPIRHLPSTIGHPLLHLLRLELCGILQPCHDPPLRPALSTSAGANRLSRDRAYPVTERNCSSASALLHFHVVVSPPARHSIMRSRWRLSLSLLRRPVLRFIRVRPMRLSDVIPDLLAVAAGSINTAFLASRPSVRIRRTFFVAQQYVAHVPLCPVRQLHLLSIFFKPWKQQQDTQSPTAQRSPHRRCVVMFLAPGHDRKLVARSLSVMAVRLSLGSSKFDGESLNRPSSVESYGSELAWSRYASLSPCCVLSAHPDSPSSQNVVLPLFALANGNFSRRLDCDWLNRSNSSPGARKWRHLSCISLQLIGSGCTF